MKKLGLWILVICALINLTACQKKEKKEETSAGKESFASSAQFSMFSFQIKNLHDDMITATETVTAQIAMASIPRKTLAQRINYIACGGSIKALSGSEANAIKWLSEDNAQNTITKIEEFEVFAGRKATLKVNVNSLKEPNNEATCYVTGNGNVFCWPPFLYDGKSYVNDTTTAKDSAGKEISKMGSKLVYLTFSDGEKVEIKANNDKIDSMQIISK